MNALVVLAVGLALPGFLPALAVARRSLVLVFLAPVVGAGMAAMAAAIELGVGGSLVVNYAVVAVVVNLAVLGWWLAGRRHVLPRAGRTPAGASWRWSGVTLVVLLACLAIPLTSLRSPMIGGDANYIWLTHSFMAYGGHHAYLTGLQNPAYRFSNPDYPPLVPAAGALAFSFFGLGNLHLAVDMTELLTACALGIAGTGIAAAGAGTGAGAAAGAAGSRAAGAGTGAAGSRAAGAGTGAAGSRARPLTRIAAIAAGGALCLASFTAAGFSGVEGFADLMWSAAAASAVIWGLVLPRGSRALAVSWICAAAASLTKNEGLTTALVILVLIALRYRPPRWPEPVARRWAERAALAGVPALPGLAWAGLIHLIGVHDAFFRAVSGESPVTRAEATIAGMAAHLAIAPVALAVLIAGCLFLRTDRRHAGLGNPAWLWLSCIGAQAIIFGTYVIGGLEIHSWLATSVDRTTIFAQVMLYTDLAVWLVLAADGAFARTDAPAATRTENRPDAVVRARA